MPKIRTGYSVQIQPSGPFAAYLEGEAGTIEEALATIERLKSAKNGADFVLLDDDHLELVDPDGKVIQRWSRDAFTTVPDGGLVGWQILGPEGYNIFGDDDDPFDLPSFAILMDSAAPAAREWVAAHPGYVVAPVMHGDIEEPEYFDSVSLRAPTP